LDGVKFAAAEAGVDGGQEGGEAGRVLGFDGGGKRLIGQQAKAME
jgi:hypothetical protein